ncbi:MAG: hypothetical protein AAF654_10980 [Myxococcota bacterium]
MSDAQSMSDDDVFDSALVEQTVEPTPEEAPSEPAEQPAAEPEPTAESADAQTGSEESDSEDVGESGPRTVPIQAVQEERKKRQQAQADLEAARQQLAYLQAQSAGQGKPPAEQQEAKTFWEDPEAAMAEQSFRMRSDMSEAMVASRHKDYAEARDAFAAAARQNPALWSSVKNHPLPAQFVYDQGKAILEFGDAKSPEEYRAKIESEVKSRLEAEFEQERQKLREQYAVEGASQVPRTNAGARSVSSSDGVSLSDSDIWDEVTTK